jgi:sugar phosphate isomerase/epimerase
MPSLGTIKRRDCQPPRCEHLADRLFGAFGLTRPWYHSFRLSSRHGHFPCDGASGCSVRQLVEGYGLPTVELTLDLSMVYPGVFDGGFYSSVADLQQELAFTCTVHLPFLWLDAASLNNLVHQASVDSLCRSVDLTRSLEVHTYVLHLWGPTAGLVASEFEHDIQRDAVFEALTVQAESSLAEPCTILEPRDLCAENLEDSMFDLALLLIERYRTGICLDVGHLAWTGDDAMEFLALHASSVHEVRLHDAVCPGPEDAIRFRDHPPLRNGNIDYVSLLNRLEAAGFDGPVILEVNSIADLEQSLGRLGAGQFGHLDPSDSEL